MSQTVVIRVGSAKQVRQELRADLAAIEHGEPVTPTREIWFSSLRQLATILTEPRVDLLRLIRRRHPRSLGALARLAGRSARSIEADLRVLTSAGFVSMIPSGKTKRPVAAYDRIQLAADIAIARAAA